MVVPHTGHYSPLFATVGYNVLYRFYACEGWVDEKNNNSLEPMCTLLLKEEGMFYRDCETIWKIKTGT